MLEALLRIVHTLKRMDNVDLTVAEKFVLRVADKAIKDYSKEYTELMSTYSTP